MPQQALRPDAAPALRQIASDQLRVSVSDLGAEMQSLDLADGRALLWHGDAAFWNGRSPILFPIVGATPEDHVTIDGQRYPMKQHGFARRLPFRLVEAGPAHCRHALEADAETRAAYPFDFRLELEHRVEGATLTVTAEVTNTDARPLPFGLGFHPAFCWPLPGAQGQPHQVRLANGAAPEMLRLHEGLLTEDRLPSPFAAGQLTLAPAQFEANAMVFPEGAGDALVYSAPGAPQLAFRFENLPNLALWTKPGAPFLCIEPWHGMAALHGAASPELADRPSSLTLAPGAVARFAFSVTVSG